MATPEGLPHLVLLPGLLNDGRLWSAQIEGLSDHAHCTVGVLTGSDSITSLAKSVLDLAPSRRFALAGLSMGGYVALEIMRQAPERITALALLDTSARPDTPEATEGRHALMARAETDFPGVIDTLRQRLMTPEHSQAETSGGVFATMAADLGPSVFQQQQRAIMNRIDSRPFLPRITCPTLVLCGREDLVTPVAVHQEMAEAIPDAHEAVVEDCGHLSTLEQPQHVLNLLIGWLSRIDSMIPEGA